MKTNFLFLALFTFILVSCSQDNSVFELSEDDIQVETRRGQKNCNPIDIPCGDWNNVLDILVGNTNYGVGSTGSLDRLLNCDLPNNYCYRECLETKYNIGPYFLQDDECENGFFTAERQQEIIDQLKQDAIYSPPTCNGIPMIPLSYDTHWDVVGSIYSSYVILVDVRYGSECDDLPDGDAG